MGPCPPPTWRAEVPCPSHTWGSDSCRWVVSAAGPQPRRLKAHRVFHSSPPVFGVEPDLTREGGSIPVTLTFQAATGKNVMLLPVGSADDGAHSQNEKLNR